MTNELFSKIQMPVGWAKTGITIENGIQFKKTRDLTLNLEVMTDLNKCKSVYDVSLGDSTGHYKINKSNNVINDLKVNIVNAIDQRNNNTFTDFFFEKKGKYYHVATIDYTDSYKFKEDIYEALLVIIKNL